MLSFGQIAGGQPPNVLPEEVMIAGSVRGHSEAARTAVHGLLRDAAESTRQAFGTLVTVTIDAKVPVLMNDPACAERVRQAINRALGPERLIAEPPPVMASEDFSLFLRHLPGAYLFVGQDGTYCHHPEYRFDTRIIPTGAAIFILPACQEICHDAFP